MNIYLFVLICFSLPIIYFILVRVFHGKKSDKEILDEINREK